MGIRHTVTVPSIELVDWNLDHTGAADAVDVTQYGAANGANSSTGIQAAITEVVNQGGGTAYIPPGTYLINTPIVLPSNVRLLGAGPTSILQKADGNSATCAIEATGTLGTTVALTATSPPVYGSTTVSSTLNPATLVAGDFVLIRDTQYTNTVGGNFGRNQELNRIKSVSGAGPFTYTLANRLISTYLTGSSAEMLKLTPANSARVESLQVTVPGNAPTTVDQLGGCIGFDLAYDCSVTNVDLRGAYTLPAIRVLRSAHLVFAADDIRDGQDISNGLGYGYGINVGESSHDCVITDCYFESIRENDFTNNARNCIFTNNVARRTEIHAISTHGAGGGRLVISNNNIHGSGQNGITLSAGGLSLDTDVLISGNYIEDYANYAVITGGGSPGSVTAINIVGNYFGACGGTGDGYMLGVEFISNQISVRGNTFDNTNGGALNAAILVNNNAAAANILDTVIDGNDFRNISGQGIIVGKATRTIIRNNHFTAISANNVDTSTLGGGVQTRVYGNTADDSTVNKLAADLWWDNVWGTALEHNGGTSAIATGATIAHGLRATPTKYGATGTVAGMICTVTAVSSTTITVAHNGGGTQTVAWWAET